MNILGNTLEEIAGEKAGIFKIKSQLLRCLSLTKQCLKRRQNGLRVGLDDLPLLSNLNLNRCNITDDSCEKFSRSSSGHHQHQHQHHHHHRQVVEEVLVQRVKKEEVNAKISAWQNNWIAKINNRFKREDAVIKGWESEQVQKATSWMKKVEVFSFYQYPRIKIRS
ncbi:uncharacterized protein LOC107635003 isoform X1 [Arachis ipaensis]|uniref:uncharacterized protein LOC107635003 isoform X1 n=1 Tax=Arachis ipaensis TaxID=130454 RepID=UPI000A2B3DC1|nr:uncharacterized protein LOC107635003 isoform X1 [Arachis ipaensis]XP_020977423.1 uncharacterized protein LOC107635003 isoform X1 [Arachis ipaensis]XP_020977425.1 uncharacterized protein LOC107635003 isoform X1 [Arachis ipaensis]XP_020977426.1 uncharacterized protein LOC107635003 isoform X1 [Arachis ipaensis]XP_020977427.1 uncharacterized protein LOC107635003 isoform X1 [Arachis ipaensis]XP_020977428.1 uncharacterized protein LOC107635003 isoform X1 [Arachis ipaensis]XP_020977429.1 uncharac